MRILAGRTSDLDAVCALDRESFGPDAWSRTSIAAELAVPGRVLVGLQDDAAVVGFSVVALAGDVADLRRIVVAPARRRSGLGGVLLGAALADAARQGAATVLLEVAETNEPALGLYRSSGFEQVAVRPRYYSDGGAALVLRAACADPEDPT